MASIRMMYRGVTLGSLIAALSAIVTGRAEAHVKWFCGAVDVTTPLSILTACCHRRCWPWASGH
jgi:hypothetical protein